MDLITNLANKFVLIYLSSESNKYQEIINQAKSHASEIDSQLDKIEFINIILEANNKYYQKHLLTCKNLVDCPKNFSHENISYFLKQELSRLGVQINSDAFTSEQKKEADTRLDKILSDLSSLKAGQQVIYEDLQNEINELRTLFFLGKKNWYQLLIGKSTEMVASGVISATISEKIVDSLNHLPALLSN